MKQVLTAFLVAAVILICPLVALAQDSGPSSGPESPEATDPGPEGGEEVVAPAAAEAPTRDATNPPSIPEAIAADPVSGVTQFIGHIRAGHWKLAAVFGLGLLMFLLRKARQHTKIFKGDRGGAILVGLLGIGGAVTTALVAEAFDWKVLLGGLLLVWTSVGGYTWVKKLIWPKDDEDDRAETSPA